MSIDHFNPEKYKFLVGPNRLIYESLAEKIASFPHTIGAHYVKDHIDLYASETYFAGIQPQQSRLVIYLWIPIARLKDPQGICEDNTRSATKEHGYVRFFLMSDLMVDYALGLVKQALDYRLSGRP